MREFKIGFMGSALGETSRWAAQQAFEYEHKRICVPFTGSCKSIAAMAREDTIIESWDTQILSRAVIEGVFKADKIVTAIDKPRYKKGYMYDTRGLKGIDTRSAGFIDYVGAHGTLADKVAVFSATVRCTLMGRMNQWDSDVDKLWDKFVKQREHLKSFTNLPGTFIHHEANVYEEKPTGPYDFTFIDPPKVVDGGKDIYSQNYVHINRALGGKCELPPWSWRDTPARLRMLFEMDTKSMALIYVSDVRPTFEDVKKLMERYGTTIDQIRAMHRSRYDYAVYLRKDKNVAADSSDHSVH